MRIGLPCLLLAAALPHLALSKSYFSGKAVNAKNFINSSSSQSKIIPKGVNLIIQKDALETQRKFLFTAAMSYSSPAVMGNTLAPKIVTFKIDEEQKKVILFEDTEGQDLSISLKSQKIVATLPIVAVSESNVEVNFEAGMQNLIYADWYISDFAGPERTDSSFISFKIKNSYVKQVKNFDSATLIEQFAILEALNFFGTQVDLPISIKYTLSEYNQNRNFPSKESNLQKQVGFFEVEPQYTPGVGDTSVKIIKYDLNKTHTYYLSNNTPQEFRSAVTAGILYWNRVFGKELFKVENLPEGISVHDPGYNVFQWIDFDSAGFAYADMLADPKTGEILQSSVYMTSVFGKSVMNMNPFTFDSFFAHQNLTGKKIQIGDDTVAVNNPKAQIKLNGFKSYTTCNKTAERAQSFDLVKSILMSGVYSKEAALRVAQDYVTSVVAHEIGHTLGLRHNFAGQVGSNIKNEEYKATVSEYIKTGNVAEAKSPSTSVMDYLSLADDVLVGAKIRLNQKPLDYDLFAVQWGYSDKNLSDFPERPLFCTDSHAASGRYQDCDVFDSGSNSVESAKDNLVNTFNNLHLSIAGAFYSAKNPVLNFNKKSVKEVELSVPRYVIRLQSALFDYLKHFSTQAKYLVVEAKHGFQRVNKAEEIEEDNKAKMISNYKLLGGADWFVSEYLVKENVVLPFIEEARKKFSSLLQSEAFLEGINIANGEKYSFTTSEVMYMSETVNRFFDKLKEPLLNGLLQSLARNDVISQLYNAFLPQYFAKNYVMNLDQATKLENTFSKVAESIIFASSINTFTTTFKNSDKPITVTLPFYKRQTRIDAGSLLNPSLYTEWPDFGAEGKIQIIKRHTTRVKDLMGTETNYENLSRQLKQFIIDENSVINTLPAQPTL